MKKYEEPEIQTHAFAETRDLRPLDQRLRRHGFEIHARPANGPAMWKRRGSGELFTAERALEMCGTNK